MLTPQENERLTRVGPGTPAGELFRRYWLPALLSSELPEADGAPIRTRILCEDLIAFRGSDGIVGIVDAYCPHRRAPMFFGRNEECGLRCVYHGWKFDRDGACVDMPSEPPDSLFKTKVNITAYPTCERGEIVWVYMGPPEDRPPEPDYEFVRAPASHRFISKHVQDCNYLQALEGALDSAHATILHNLDVGDMTWLADYDRTVPRLDVETTDYGYSYSGVRHVDGKQWVRAYQYIMPAIQMRGRVDGLLGGSYRYIGQAETATINGHVWTPIDDHTVASYNFMYSYDPAQALPRQNALDQERKDGRGPDLQKPDFRLIRNLSNDFMIDRHAQKTTSFAGIEGVNTQDIAMQEGMGPIVDRSQEHLGTTDRAVIVMRQLMLEATHRVERGETLRGRDPSTYRMVRALDHMIPEGAPWREALAQEILAKF
jgi:phenylpropionate dioxygenase-like ring-hydroxylating dioxygenase large terminal subunit